MTQKTNMTMTDVSVPMVGDSEADGRSSASVRSAVMRTRWRDLNWRSLVAEIRGLTHRLEHRSDANADPERAALDAEVAAARDALSAPSALDQLQARFALSEFERNVVVLCAAFAIDADLVRDYGQPTFALAVAVTDHHVPRMLAFSERDSRGDARPRAPSLAAGAPAGCVHWSVMPGQPLIQHRIIEIGDHVALLHAPIYLDPRVLSYLIDAPGVDPRLAEVLRPVAAAELMPSHRRLAAAICDTWRDEQTAPPVIELWGGDAEARRAIAAAACQVLGQTLYAVRLHRVPRELDDAQLVRRLTREARLEPAVFLLEDSGGDPAMQARLRALVEDLAAPIVLASRDRARPLARPSVALEVMRPSMAEQRALLHEALVAEGIAGWPGVRAGVERVVGQFDLSAAAIRAACLTARRRVIEAEHSEAAEMTATAMADAGATADASASTAARRARAFAGVDIDASSAGAAETRERKLDGPDTSRAAAAHVRAIHEPDAATALWDACRAETRTHLDDLAQRSAARVGWRDLVVGKTQDQALREITQRVRQRARVHDHWGFGARSGRGLGITALFMGPSGTGKTLAAEVLANELQLDLHRIDLSQVVSKYIGETERNLGRVFDAAEAGGAVLLFDEADALFGKRSEVKDSHDRYANIEVGYLLQRMEAYRGLAVLTTNLRSSLDPAFQRRIAFIVEFALPDEAQRRSIWRTVFPSQLPTQGLDFDRLARLPLSGGSIRNVALTAAYAAADHDVPVGMAHIAAAARTEYVKLDRTAPSELGKLL